MATDMVLNVRVSREERDQAAEILDKLGVNLSLVVNVLIKQIILTKSVPFSIAMPTEDKSVTSDKSVSDGELLAKEAESTTLPNDVVPGSYADTSDIDKFNNVFEKVNSNSGNAQEALSEFIRKGF